MERCLFCDCDLATGSEEHVFLSALGGRIATHRATCNQCNNAFASDETGKVDDALAEAFKEVRNGLKIWSGRNGPPPTLQRAGTMLDGSEIDLAPGFVPVLRPGRLPAASHLITGSEVKLVARNEADAKRLLDILSRRGISATNGSATRVWEKAPTIHLSVSFDGPKVWRTVAKTAVVAFVVLYGNEQARHLTSKDLRHSIRYGTPSIDNFVGWDFINDWPVINSLQPHPKTPAAQPSGFEHSLVITDVQGHSVAYVTFFGSWRFSVLLGPKTNLAMRGLAINPRSLKPARFIITGQEPGSYVPKSPSSFAAENADIQRGVKDAFDRAFHQWSDESRADYAQLLADELGAILEESGEDEARRAAAIRTFAEMVATVELGATWATDLDTIFDEDTSQIGTELGR